MIYALRDSKCTISDISRIDNFQLRWLQLIQNRMEAKFANVDMKDFKSTDVAVIYMDNSNPYGKLRFPSGMKKIFIVGKVDKNNINYLNDADHIIYTNHVQQSIVENIGNIHKPSTTCPRYPLHSFNTTVTKKKRVFIGGWMDVNLFEQIVALHRTLPKEYDFYVMTVGSGARYEVFAKNLTDMFKNSEINGNRYVRLQCDIFHYENMLLQIRASEKAFLYKKEPTHDTIIDMLKSSDKKILEHSIGESSMLAHCQASGCEILGANTISYLPFIEKNDVEYTYSLFVDKLIDIIN